MAEYIDREAVLLEINRQIRRQFLCIANVETIIKDAPAADVAPVVRCKDCTYAELYEGSECLYCRNIAGLCTYVMDDDYCSYGERKDSEA